MCQIDRNSLEKFFSGIGKSIYNSAEKCISEFSMMDQISGGVLVGLSGGADSVMLLCFLLEYRRRNNFDFNIVCAHINHGIRDEEADSDEIFCKELCDQLNIELITKGYSVPILARNSKMGIEETARFVRYTSFRDIISGRNDISCVAIAHNLSDNAETVVFNILRGSGTRGASGIAPVRDNIIRPLIRVSKYDIEKAIREANIPFVIDSTNLSSDYTRNYIRNDVMPLFKRIADNPEVAISRFSDNMRSDDSFIRGVAEEFLKENDTVYNHALRSLHFSVFVRVLGMMANKHGSISANIAKDVYALLTKDNFSYSLIGENVFVCERGVCSVKQNIGDVTNYCFEVNEGITDLSPLNAVFVYSKEKTFSNVYKISIQANLSSAIISGSLYLRPKMNGDSVYYGGMTHKVKKLFCDNKIPRSKRGLIPLLCDDNGVVWVPGFGVRDDNIPKDQRVDTYVVLGIKDNEADEIRLYSGSEFRT